MNKTVVIFYYYDTRYWWISRYFTRHRFSHCSIYLPESDEILNCSRKQNYYGRMRFADYPEVPVAYSVVATTDERIAQCESHCLKPMNDYTWLLHNCVHSASYILSGRKWDYKAVRANADHAIMIDPD